MPRPDPGARGHNSSLITEDEVHEALMLLNGASCDQLGAARAAVAKADHMLKRARSIMVLRSAQRTADLREAEALASAEYLQQINNLHDATLVAESLYARRRGAEATIQAFQTMEASRRASRV